MLMAFLAEGAAQPTAFGFNAEFWLSLAILFVFLLLVWKLPPVITAMLDKKIVEIKGSLDEAEGLRKEAEALKAEYEAKAKNSAKEAEQMLANAKSEADAIVKQAKADADDLIVRRRKMAEEKIAAAERNAIADVRAKAADAATRAAGTLIASKHDAAADKKLVDDAIGNLGGLN